MSIQFFSNVSPRLFSCRHCSRSATWSYRLNVYFSLSYVSSYLELRRSANKVLGPACALFATQTAFFHPLCSTVIRFDAYASDNVNWRAFLILHSARYVSASTRGNTTPSDLMLTTQLGHAAPGVRFTFECDRSSSPLARLPRVADLKLDCDSVRRLGGWEVDYPERYQRNRMHWAHPI
uniref:Uncharacterized protein n=1 Tax=Mycena chlorophos TaxID=658473 RepID=A0ABQ0L305_MYCCL|nr:predicted protein [Mycena chlorophos]